MFYLLKTPKWVRKLYGGTIWQMPETDRNIYLTFDDGPHPVITPLVLDELSKYDAKATFFCIGKNVQSFPAIYKRILDEGHAVGNHTFDHLNGWKTDTEDYKSDILKAGKYIDSDLFRPPYGRITRKQQKDLTSLNPPFKIIMWSILSGDFDVNLSPQQCYENVKKNTTSGSVIVFHDSEKAKERMSYTLPLLLKYFNEKGYSFKQINFN